MAWLNENYGHSKEEIKPQVDRVPGDASAYPGGPSFIFLTNSTKLGYLGVPGSAQKGRRPGPCFMTFSTDGYCKVVHKPYSIQVFDIASKSIELYWDIANPVAKNMDGASRTETVLA